MKIYRTFVFVDSGTDDDPESREVYFAVGHVDRHEFATALKLWPQKVQHVYALLEEFEGLDENEPEGPDFSWWSHTQTDECDTPVTMVFI
jgi:hypothetical protein